MVNLVQVMAPNDPRQQIADALSAQALPQQQPLPGQPGPSYGSPGGQGFNNDIFTIAKKLFSNGGGGRTVDMGNTPLPSDAFSDPVPTAAGAAPAADAGLTDLSGAAAANAGALPAVDMGIADASLAPAAGSGAGAGAGVGAGAGAAGAAAGIAIPTYLGLTTAPYRLDSSWWNNFNNELTKGVSPNTTYNSETSPAQQEYNAQQSLYRMLQTQGNDTATLGGASGNNIPSGFLALAKQYGMLNADGSLNTKWSGGQDPSLVTAAIQARQGVKGGSGGGRIL